MRQCPEGIEVIKGAKPGPKIGIMAVVHGDEPAGLAALAFLKTHFETTPLASGELWLIQGNLEAHRAGQRCVTHDMNRMMLPEDTPELADIDRTTYDYRRSRELMPVLAQLDYLLDLHNTTRESPPFSLAMADDARHQRLLTALPVQIAASGFGRAIQGTTCDWMARHGGVAITVECGYQGDVSTGDVAIACTQSFLGMLGFAEFQDQIAAVESEVRVVAHEHIIDKATFLYTRAYQNFDQIAPHELVARDALHEYRAPDLPHLRIIFPVSMKTIREGSNTSAFFLAATQERTRPSDVSMRKPRIIAPQIKVDH